MNRNLIAGRLMLVMLLLVAGMAVVRAELKKNPDENTLWMEDGENFKTGEGSSAKHWSGMPGQSAEGGGFTLSHKPEQGYSTGRYLPYDPAYPWAVWEISSVEYRKPEKQGAHVYKAINFQVPFKQTALSMVSHIKEGLFTVDISRALPEKPKTMYTRIYLYGSDVTFRYLKCVKAPATRIEVSSPQEDMGKIKIGDTVNVKVVLEKPAAGVTLDFYHNYTMPRLEVDGARTLELKPEGEAPARTFTGSFVFQDVKRHRLKPKQTGFGVGAFVIRARCTDGGPGMDIWTANPFTMQVREAE